MGNLYSWQGLDDLLEVLHDLQADGFDLSLVVVGDGQMRQKWESQARSLGLSNRVEFVGQVSWDEVPDYIAGFDLGYSGHVKLQIGTMYHSPLKIYE